MDRPKISQERRTEHLRQPVTCPWVANQPYPSSLTNKNRSSGQRRNSNVQINSCSNNHWETSFPQSGCAARDPTYSSMQQSSNQFFLFLRLMQLFPHTHPATLHSVLYICKNDFFCAIDKLLYAKRCRLLYSNRKNQLQHQRAADKFTVVNRSGDVNSFKRSFSKCRNEEENDSDKGVKRLTVNKEEPLENLDAGANGKMQENAMEIGGQYTDSDEHVEPVETIKFITIKANKLRQKLNTGDIEKLDMKFSHEIS